MSLSLFLSAAPSQATELIDSAKGLIDKTQQATEAVQGLAESTEQITQLASNLPAIISNNYSLLIGIFVAFFAYSILKSGVKIILTIIAIGFAVTVLTNMGIIPDLNNIIDSLRGVAPAA